MKNLDELLFLGIALVLCAAVFTISVAAFTTVSEIDMTESFRDFSFVKNPGNDASNITIIPINNSGSIPIPDNYYNCSHLFENETLQSLTEGKWEKEYKFQEWDCSQMGAYMEFMLENIGYHTVICERIGHGTIYGHVWIMVELEDGWTAYECTGKFWVYPDEEAAKAHDSTHWDPEAYESDNRYETIYDVFDYNQKYDSGAEWFMIEYAWWIVK